MAATSPAPALSTQPGEVSPAPTEAQASVSAAGTPDWVGEIWRKYTTRVLDYLRQSFALLVSPRRFMEAWATGQREALNPLRFLSLGFLLAVTARHLGERYLLGPALEAQGAAAVLKTPMGVELVFIVLALPAHGVMRLSGSRAPLRASMAAVIFAFMGPVMLLQVFGWLLSGLLLVSTGSIPLLELKGGMASRLYRHSAYPWPIIMANWAALFYFVRALAGVHRARWGWAFLALIVAHAVFIPFIATLTKLDAQDLSGLLGHVKGWLGQG